MKRGFAAPPKETRADDRSRALVIDRRRFHSRSPLTKAREGVEAEDADNTNLRDSRLEVLAVVRPFKPPGASHVLG